MLTATESRGGLNSLNPHDYFRFLTPCDTVSNAGPGNDLPDTRTTDGKEMDKNTEKSRETFEGKCRLQRL